MIDQRPLEGLRVPDLTRYNFNPETADSSRHRGCMRHNLIELGMGTDLHKPDPTECAVRAVREAIYRCSMVRFFERVC
jgi:hypothetical protein